MPQIYLFFKKDIFHEAGKPHIYTTIILTILTFPTSPFSPFFLQFTPPRLNNHAMPLIQPTNRITHHLVHDRLCAFLLRHHRRRLAHEKGPSIIHGLIVEVIAQGFEVVLDGDNAFFREIFDLLRAVLNPVFDVRVVLYAERSALRGGEMLVGIEGREKGVFLVGLNVLIRTVKMMVRILSSKLEFLMAS